MIDFCNRLTTLFIYLCVCVFGLPTEHFLNFKKENLILFVPKILFEQKLIKSKITHLSNWKKILQHFMIFLKLWLLLFFFLICMHLIYYFQSEISFIFSSKNNFTIIIQCVFSFIFFSYQYLVVVVVIFFSSSSSFFNSIWLHISTATIINVTVS